MTMAHDIYQAWLDHAGGLQWHGKTEALAKVMHSPRRMETEDGGALFVTPRHMAGAAAGFRAFLQRIGASGFDRICNGAAFAKDDSTRIDGTHTTYLLRGGNNVVDPFKSQMTLVHRDGVWLGAGLRSAVSNHTCTILSPAHLVAQRQTQAGHRKEG